MDQLEQRVSAVLAEMEPVKRAAMARRLRTDIWDLLGEDETEKLTRKGFDIEKLRKVLRLVE